MCYLLRSNVPPCERAFTEHLIVLKTVINPFKSATFENRTKCFSSSDRSKLHIVAIKHRSHQPRILALLPLPNLGCSRSITCFTSGAVIQMPIQTVVSHPIRKPRFCCFYCYSLLWLFRVHNSCSFLHPACFTSHRSLK